MDMNDLMREVRSHNATSNHTCGEQELEALARIDRGRFVPADGFNIYGDNPVAIGFGVNCSQPFVNAFMAGLLQLYDGARVAEVGTGCGYMTALLAELAGQKGVVHSYEIIPDLAAVARENLQRHFGVLDGRVRVYEGDAIPQILDGPPVDRLCFTAAADERLPVDELLRLFPGNGIMVLPTKELSILRYTVCDGWRKKEEFGGFGFVPLQGRYGWEHPAPKIHVFRNGAWEKLRANS